MLLDLACKTYFACVSAHFYAPVTDRNACSATKVPYRVIKDDPISRKPLKDNQNLELKWRGHVYHHPISTDRQRCRIVFKPINYNAPYCETYEVP